MFTPTIPILRCIPKKNLTIASVFSGQTRCRGLRLQLRRCRPSTSGHAIREFRPSCSCDRDFRRCYSDFRASLHGKDLNRFWSNIEGYNGPILVLISATLEDHIVG
ncbi:hypothetical protein L2E82_16569 [Cichorium intybus]|uniref:Uncharacterized protein n=1 Tax=Cichorium intybus TaxID=13427 RepID=A0ACB9F6D5_CICIN|nr:hypothetical protein L2E82_16569 [Cichorium intybus]